jgi:hypothetical protein
MWPWILVVVPVVALFSPDRSGDPRHAVAHSATRKAVIIGSGVIFLASLAVRPWLRSLRKANPDFDFPSAIPAHPKPVARLTCLSTRSAFWRCNFYVLLRKPSNLMSLWLLGMAPGFVIGWDQGYRDLLEVPGLFVAAQAASIAAMVGLVVMGLSGQFPQRFPKPDSVRVCEITLTPQGFRDQTPDSLHDYRWEQVQAIHEHAGDIYVWAQGNKGCYIASDSFTDRDEARRFARAARELQRSQGRTWPLDELRLPFPDQRTAKPSLTDPVLDNPYAAPQTAIHADKDPLAGNLGAAAFFIIAIVAGDLALFGLSWLLG